MLKNFVGLVTGGASGLGKATVERLIREGARVTIVDLPTSNGQEIVKNLNSSSDSGAEIQKCQFIPCDIRNEYEVQEALNATKDTFQKLNGVINCAGIAHSRMIYNFNQNKPQNLKDFTNCLMTNVVGTFNVIRLSVELMSHNDPDPDGQRGVIVNTASIAAFDGSCGQAAYAAAMGGIVGMTLPIARDLSSHGIRCVTIAPGFFDTPMTDFLPDNVNAVISKSTPFPSRFGKPEEFSQLVQQVIENKMINGEVIRLDGGLRPNKKF